MKNTKKITGFGGAFAFVRKRGMIVYECLAILTLSARYLSSFLGKSKVTFFLGI